ncbi:uncharacterized protein [Spinacia oleracea]|uniref:Uncharacterized protein isoform X2 n=1 Tax=Spinacia oleracea TaxID=3562 RepID=A0A9R0J5K2_SPIOL|nr:uncharacterized protein LOC110800666 isoform X2 [Spinacia oleracea]
MSNKREKEAGREKNSGGQGLVLLSNNIGTGKPTRTGKLSDNSVRKSCSATVPCSPNKIKKAEECTGAAKKAANNGGVSETEPKKSGAKTVSSRVWKARDSVEVKHTASEEGEQETAQVTPPPRIVKRTDKKTTEKVASPQQVWREKAQPESTDTKELSARKQQLQSTKTTDSSPLTSKSKKSATQKKVKNKEPSSKEQSSKGKQVQKKKAEHHKASTSSRSDLAPPSYLEYHLEWDGFNEPVNHIGVCCSLCEMDLGVAPYDGYDDGDSEFSAIPVVAVLPCGHSFHYYCLNLGELEGQQEEPPCIFCESFMSS